MSTWGDELARVRRYLRDPNANIWSDELLRKLWAELQSDLSRRLRALEDVRAMSVPPRVAWSYLHGWEREYALDTTSSYQALWDQGGHFVCAALWEAQEFAGIAADISDEGDAVTMPWEAWLATQEGARPASFPLPDDFRAMRAMYYDREPLPYRAKKEITSADPSWQSRSGEPQAYYREDETSNAIVIWPRPSTASWSDDLDSGMGTDITGQTVSAETGAIVYSQDYEALDDAGAVFGVVDVDDALLLVMDIEPREPVGFADELSLPDYLNRYVRFGVIGRAYGANTQGRIPSLGQLWTERYEVGIRDLRAFFSKRRQDRDYRFVTQGLAARGKRRRHPRLPDGFPAVYP